MSYQSVYSTAYGSNLPARDASWVYGYPYMTSRLPQAMWPWDAVHDVQYQTDVQNPRYKHYGMMEYPYSARRHRTPLVYVKPRPAEYQVHGLTYQIPQYPPPIYWYPNPVTCEDSCGSSKCQDFYGKQNDYRMCQMCQNLKSPMCWDPKSRRCVDCLPEHSLESCEQRFGSRNPNGWLHANVAPINPKYTGCQLAGR